MRTQFRSTYLDKLHTKDTQKTHRQPRTFPELDNLNLTDIEVHGFIKREEEEVEKIVREMLWR